MATLVQPSPAALAERIYARRWLTLGVLGLSLVIMGIDNFVLNVALPTIQGAFNASASELQWMVDAYILVFAGLLLTMGAIGDRFGRARLLQVGLLVFGAGSIAATLVTTATQLIAARAVMGFGAAMMIPSTLSILINVFPREERGRAIAAWAGMMGLGIGLGPITGGVLIVNFSWPAVFLINVPVVLAALALGLFLVPDNRDPEHFCARPPGRGSLDRGRPRARLRHHRRPADGLDRPGHPRSSALAAVLAAALGWREMHTTHPMLDFTLFRNRRMTFGVTAVGAAFFGLFSMIFGLTQYLQYVLGKSPLEAGEIMLPLAIGIPIGAGLSVRLVRRLGTRRVVSVALVLVAAVIASVSTWTASTEGWVVALALDLRGDPDGERDGALGRCDPRRRSRGPGGRRIGGQPADRPTGRRARRGGRRLGDEHGLRRPHDGLRRKAAAAGRRAGRRFDRRGGCDRSQAGGGGAGAGRCRAERLHRRPWDGCHRRRVRHRRWSRPRGAVHAGPPAATRRFLSWRARRPVSCGHFARLRPSPAFAGLTGDLVVTKLFP